MRTLPTHDFYECIIECRLVADHLPPFGIFYNNSHRCWAVLGTRVWSYRSLILLRYGISISCDRKLNLRRNAHYQLIFVFCLDSKQNPWPNSKRKSWSLSSNASSNALSVTILLAWYPKIRRHKGPNDLQWILSFAFRLNVIRQFLFMFERTLRS